MSREDFAETLRPLAQFLSKLDASDPSAATEKLQASFGLQSEAVAAIRAEAMAGRDGGWITPKENGAVKFGRVAKDLEGFSVDAVEMTTPGPRHRHPQGEFDLCFALDGEPRFDGHPEGWVVFPPDSVHVPTVSDGRMLILYFLPEGAIEFMS